MGVEKTIIIVDDSIIARMLLSRHFQEKHKNWKVLEAEGADQALSLLEENSCDLITIDYNMPGLNGLDLIKKIKESHPNVKIAMITANIQDSLRKEVEALDVFFMEKPITSQTIEALVEL